jgi:hypothetical protein
MWRKPGWGSWPDRAGAYRFWRRVGYPAVALVLLAFYTEAGPTRSRERPAHVVDAGRAPARSQDADDIEADLAWADRAGGEPSGGGGVPADLLGDDGIGRAAELVAVADLDLDEDEVVTVPRDDIYLSVQASWFRR